VFLGDWVKLQRQLQVEAAFSEVRQQLRAQVAVYSVSNNSKQNRSLVVLVKQLKQLNSLKLHPLHLEAVNQLRQAHRFLDRQLPLPQQPNRLYLNHSVNQQALLEALDKPLLPLDSAQLL
jgi:hypothetical protein